MVKRTNIYLVLFIILILNSCASLYTDKSHYNEIDTHLSNGGYSNALAVLQQSKDNSYSQKDRVLYYLEEGMLYHYSGLYEESNDSLSKAEYSIEDLLTKSISKGILSGVLNDNALEYPGEDYEDIYINIFKSLNYLHLNKLEEALVEIRRVNFKLTLLQSKYTEEIYNLNDSEDINVPEVDFNFYNDAFARYLGIIAYRLEGLLDDARIESDYLQDAYNFQASIYNFEKPIFPEISDRNTYVNLFSFSGFAPEKLPTTIIANGRSNQLYLGDDNGLTFSYIGYPGVQNGSILKLEFPNLVEVRDPVSYVEVYINDQYYSDLELIESFDNISFEAFNLKQPLIVGKTIIRALSKAIVSDISESVIEEQYGPGAGLLASILGDVFAVVTENSDLRAARYFPSKIRGLEVILEPGYYDFSYVYYNNNGNEIHREEFHDVEIKERDLNILESHLLRKK